MDSGHPPVCPCLELSVLEPCIFYTAFNTGPGMINLVLVVEFPF